MSDPIKLCIIGVPGSGKSTLARRLAERLEVAYLHGSVIVRQALPDYDPSTGQMASEPEATLAISAAIDERDELGKGWVLDGFPRSMRQFKIVRGIPIIYLHTLTADALKRSKERGRFSIEAERFRLTEQTRLLRPLKDLAAVIIPTSGRTIEQVYLSAIAWLEREQQPWHQG